jgi:hypothetical protein
MLVALIIYAVYFNLVDVARTWVELEKAWGIWWAPGVLALLVIILYVPWMKLWRHVNVSRPSADST